MDAKNLPLKFLVIAGVAAVCLWSLLTKGCQQGIDLRGGHSLIFEIRTPKAEIAQLKARKKELESDLKAAKAAGEAEKVKTVQGAIARVEEDIERRQRGLTEGDIAERMIRILKERIDPQGLRNLEWRPVGSNRIEVRMPAGSKDTQVKQRVYRRALEALEARNVDPGRQRRFLEAAGPQREAMLRGFSARQQERMKELAEAHDAEARAREALEAAVKSKDAAKIKRARADYDDARAKTRAKDKALDELNIRPGRLEAILANYRTLEEEEALKPKERDELRAQLKKQLAAFRTEHAGREAQIDNVVAAYKLWSNVRRRLDDPADLQRLIAKAGVLEFRIVTGLTGPYGAIITPEQKSHYVDLLKKEGPEEVRRRGGPFAWFPVRVSDRDSFAGLILEEYAGRSHVLLCNQTGWVMLRDPRGGGWSLTEARRDSDEMGRLAVGFEFDEAGAKRFYNLTSSHKGKLMAILLDDEAISAPRIKEAISQRGIITGSFTPEEVDEMVRLLEAGSLPARLDPNPVAVRSFGPTLGAENRRQGIRAAYMGLICVALFMLLYYLLAGFIADVALLLNIIFVLGFMSALNAVFTLPGIAGVILTIGIAVDANVLIFERLREEQAKGQSIRMAIKNAYQRAFSAIFDANLTTLITCVILGWVGTLEVRGFAITLGLGVVFSMITALLLTKWVFQAMLQAGLLKKPVFMLHIIGVPKVNWMRKRWIFWGVSLVLIGLGIASLVRQGSGIWGIEFSSGTQAVVQFKDDALIRDEAGKLVLPNDELVRIRFRGKAQQMAAADPNYETLHTTARVETLLDSARAERFLARYDRDADGRITPAERDAAGMNEEFFRALDANGDGVLDRDELEALPPAMYQISTTEDKLARIQGVAREAFGESLAKRTRCSFQFLAGKEIEGLGLQADEDGKARVKVVEDSPYRSLLESYLNGVAIAVGNVNPPLTVAQMEQRIEDLRYVGQMRRTKVIGLRVAGSARPAGAATATASGPPATAASGPVARPPGHREDRYESLAVLVKLDVVPGQWDTAAAEEVALVRDALQREEMIPALSFDAAIAAQAAQRAVMAVLMSWIAIVLYLWLRFGSIQWGFAAVICLIHDVIIVVGMVAASGWLYDTFLGEALGMESFKIDLAMVAAILTVIGYSVNDTIVVFDRIRENRGKLTTVSVPVINKSVNQTLARTLLTSGTTFIVVFIMYFWGGQGIKAFNYALLIGIIFGTYSSVAIASPLLMGFRKALVTRAAEAVAT